MKGRRNVDQGKKPKGKKRPKTLSDRNVELFRQYYRGQSCTALITLMGRKELSGRYLAQSAFYEKAKNLKEIELRRLRSIAKDGWTRSMLRGFLKNKGCAIANKGGSDSWREPSL